MSVQSGTPSPSSQRGGLRSSLRNTQLAGRPLEWYVSGWRLGLILIVVMLIYPFVATPKLIVDAIACGIFVILAVGLNIVVGYAGLLDLGYVAFYAIGAYVVATGTFGALRLDPVTGQVVQIPVLPFWP